MLFAFKQQKHNPNRPEGVPEEWAWKRSIISVHEREQYEADQWIVLESDDFQGYLANKNMGETLRVLDIVEDKFKNFHPSKIDFRRHLRPEVYLQKNVVMLPNGRPEHALYSYNGELIAEIDFVFETDAMNFMTRRKEILFYYKKDGQKGEGYTIKDDIYDASNPYHLREIMKERSESRSLIIEEIKAFLNGVLAQIYIPQEWTYSQILELAGNFWGVHSVSINSWINVGSPQFAAAIQGDAQFDFLNNEVSPGVSVRAYILQKISY